MLRLGVELRFVGVYVTGCCVAAGGWRFPGAIEPARTVGGPPSIWEVGAPDKAEVEKTVGFAALEKVVFATARGGHVAWTY